jgi:hypothetical protein
MAKPAMQELLQLLCEPRWPTCAFPGWCSRRPELPVHASPPHQARPTAQCNSVWQLLASSSDCKLASIQRCIPAASTSQPHLHHIATGEPWQPAAVQQSEPTACKQLRAPLPASNSDHHCPQATQTTTACKQLRPPLPTFACTSA